MQKFKIGDKVVVIKIDETFAQEKYDMIGWDYACTHFNTGIVTEILQNRYTVSFDPSISAYKEWYFCESDLMSLQEFNNTDKGTLEILYGRKEV